MKNILATVPKIIFLIGAGTGAFRTPRWYTFNVTTDNPEAKDTKQMLTP